MAVQVEFLTNISPDTPIPAAQTVAALASTAADLNEQLFRRGAAFHITSPLDWQRRGVYEFQKLDSDVVVTHKFAEKSVRLRNIIVPDHDDCFIENNFSEHRAVLHVLGRPFRQPLSLLFFAGAVRTTSETPDRKPVAGLLHTPPEGHDTGTTPEKQAGGGSEAATPSSAQRSWTPKIPESWQPAKHAD